MKRILPIFALVTLATFAMPAVACERHQIDTSPKTVEAAPAVPPPTIVVVPASPSNPASKTALEEIMSRPLGAAYEGCNRARKDVTVYLTQ